MGKRLYQHWKGRNKFLFGGRLVLGPDAKAVAITVVLIVVPSIVFFSCVARYLFDDFPHRSGVAILVIAVLYLACVLTFLLLTSSTDPGIIPRNRHPPEVEDRPLDFVSGQSGRVRLPRTKDVVVNGIAVRTKYCDTCMLYRPPRCSHCSVCNNCVERFDHHCPWVGQCIGQRNYRFFFMFVSSATLLCVYVFAMCTVYIKSVMDDRQCSVWTAMAKSPASILLMVYSFICVWFVGGLTFFHLYLISTNQTTYENFRYRYENKLNPYNLGMASNLRDVFCAAIPPSKNNFRAYVDDEEDSRDEEARSRHSDSGGTKTTTLPSEEEDQELHTCGNSNADEILEDGTEYDYGGEQSSPVNSSSRRSSWDHKSVGDHSIW
ncbi:hypothetical protein SELMODRAFT_92351 [Selaginella moellendorffii]|uniref:S-acyltransferase n=1 Tax=Selaginella moellendorffii TaxID=88036 RepID=D8RFM1_SELML|nr:protein S-acyltransferase 8 [Selaginella moellendorffii]EFJ28891.1 hypothetical protein SELMODRAFT_92351 [Selaginella moellendorffii]|eukprot:XP_002969767.1 protein S-acyltransferase 8 [Selaginella moellendorffii]